MMKYITKELYCSIQFFDGNYPEDVQYEDFLEQCRRIDQSFKDDGYPDGMDSQKTYDRLHEIYRESNERSKSERIDEKQENYAKKFKYGFSKHVFYYDKIKSIAFDKLNQLKPWDDKIDYTIKELGRYFWKHERAMFKLTWEKAATIKESDVSFGIKTLAGLGKHDSRLLELEIQETTIRIRFNLVFENADVATYIFKDAQITKDFDFNESTNFTCLYEELDKNEDGTFQYNMLITGGENTEPDSNIYGTLRELSINFSDVEIVDIK